MADNSYSLEIRLASKNSWFTPAEARNYYKRYARDGYCVHWWGGGQGAGAHDGLVNYFIGQGQAGNKSVNYVLSDNKITLMVNPDNVAWCQQNGNAIDISVEHQPTLNNEGYKKSGWLKEQLEQRYGKRLAIRPHSYWYATACPGTVSLDRIEQECDKWRRGVYNQPPAPIPIPPAPPPPPPPPPIQTVPIPQVTKYTLTNAKLVNIKDMSVVKTFPLDTPIQIAGKCTFNGKNFYLSAFAMQKNTKQGFLEGDLKDAHTPPGAPPTPPGTPPPPPVPVTPEWEKNLRDIDATRFWILEDTPLIDIKTGNPTGTKIFKKDEEFIGSAITSVGTKEYRITEFSFQKKIFNGVPINKLTLTAPGIPDIPPVPSLPEVDKKLNWIIAAIKAILQKLGIDFK